MTARERRVIETPQGAKLTECRESVIDKVLVCAGEIVVDHPVEVTIFGCELDVDPVGV
jgi:hypothetical protein